MDNTIYIAYCSSPTYPSVIILDSGRIQYNVYFVCPEDADLQGYSLKQLREDREDAN